MRVKREAARSASHAQGEGGAKRESRFGGGAHRYSREEALVCRPLTGSCYSRHNTFPRAKKSSCQAPNSE